MADPIHMDDARSELSTHPELAIRLFPLADAQAADALKLTPGQSVGSQSARSIGIAGTATAAKASAVGSSRAAR
ncbi:hypothetical protein GGC47_004459 [Bosea sp. OAE752]|uniref:hypothetical protein n=1 Tax=Bosea sp. OAE752 TaxID=2663873 RepID=UPI003D195CAD